jgi:transposase-like protein
VTNDSPRAVVTGDLPFPTSLPDFQRLFSDERACVDYMVRVRWPTGFVCSICGVKGTPFRISTRPRVLRCSACHREDSVTAGTVMDHSHSPLSVWFWAAYLVTSMTPGMSAVQFQRQLGLGRYETAFQILHKLRAAMVRPHRDRIGAPFPVEMDETLIGGCTRGEGRGRHHKTLVAGVVEQRKRRSKTEVDGYLSPSKALPRRGGLYAGRLRLAVIADRSAKSLETFALESIQPSTNITTDDWSGYDKLASKGYRLTQVPQRGDPDVTEAWLPLIHLAFGNLKTWLSGIHHGVSAQHLPAYLNEYTFRFNRRFYPFNAFRSLLGIVADTEPTTYDEFYEWASTSPLQSEEAKV